MLVLKKYRYVVFKIEYKIIQIIYYQFTIHPTCTFKSFKSHEFDIH